MRSFSKIYILRKCNKFFRGFRFLKFSRVGGIFFIFSSLGLKRAGFRFQKYKKSFIFRKYKKVLNLRVRKFHFLKCKEFFSGWIFLFFRAWAEKCARQPYNILLSANLKHFSCLLILTSSKKSAFRKHSFPQMRQKYLTY